MPNQTFLTQLGKIVKYHREKSGLNRLQLARLAAVGKTVIYDIEHSKASVRLNTLIKVLDVLNIQVELKSPLMERYKEENDADR